jgi:nitrite reductase (NADH) small subunit
VACPQHKKTFSLRTGKNLGGEEYCLRLFPVRIEGRDVLLEVEIENP